jgi:hypothetical protein
MASDFEAFRDHFLSIYQSAVADVAKRIDAADAEHRSLNRSASSAFSSYAADIARHEYARRAGQTLLSKPSDLGTRALTKADNARVCAELSFRYLQATLTGDQATITALEGEFKASVCDPAWAQTMIEYSKYFGIAGERREIPYVRPAVVGPRTIEIPSGAKVALVGDWGTGARPAVQILKQVEGFQPQIFIHLGDIYYSGTPEECNANFTSIANSILRGTGRDVSIFTLAGNHDMYCGGLGYYDLVRRLNPGNASQDASFFCLRTKDEAWQFLAMDTGLHDYSPYSVNAAVTHLEDDEIEWHLDRLREFPGRTILLSHHQLFSAFSAIGTPSKGQKRSAVNPNLKIAFEKMAAAGRIVAWYWGHEHALTIYEPYCGLERGRCIGHGAVPVPVEDTIYQQLKDLEQAPLMVPNTELATQGGVYTHGFALLQLGVNTCDAKYYQDIGGKPKLIYSEVIA